MFPEHLWKRPGITFDEYVKNHGIKPEKAFFIYRAIVNFMEAKNRKFVEGVTCFSDEGWEKVHHDAIKWWRELVDATFEDFA